MSDPAVRKAFFRFYVASAGANAAVDQQIASLQSYVADVSGNVQTVKDLAVDVSGNLAQTRIIVDGHTDNISDLSVLVTDVSGNLSTTQAYAADVSGNLSTAKAYAADVSGNLSTAKAYAADVSGNLSATKTDLADVSGNLWSSVHDAELERYWRFEERSQAESDIVVMLLASGALPWDDVRRKNLMYGSWGAKCLYCNEAHAHRGARTSWETVSDDGEFI